MEPKQWLLIPSSANAPIRTTNESNTSATTERNLINPREHRVIHIVQANDSYQRLEKIYGAKAFEIQYWNKLAANQKLQIGQQLLISKRFQKPHDYTVKTGDSLSTIAKENLSSISTLLALNPELAMEKPLRPGQKLILG